MQKWRFGRNFEWLICGFLLFLIVGASVWHHRAGQRHAAAYKGYSPLEWVATMNYPEGFAKNFPSGIVTYETSLAMWMYPGFDAIGLSDVDSVAIVQALEYLVLALGVFIFLQTVIPAKNRGLIWLLAMFLMVFSSSRNINLANWGQPFIDGYPYGFSDGFRLMAIGFTITRKFKIAAITLAIATLNHPLMGFQAGVFCAFTAFAHWRSWKIKEIAMSAGIFFVITIPWVLLMGHTKAGNPGEYSSLWFELMRTQSHHLSLPALGFLGWKYPDKLIPFLCFLFWMMITINDLGVYRNRLKSLYVGLISIILMTLVSYWNDLYEFSPTILKMALHRSNEVIVLAGVPLLAFWIHQKILIGSWVQKFFATTLVLIPFYYIYSPYNWLLLIVYAGFFTIEAIRSPRPVVLSDKFVICLGVGIALLPFLYKLGGIDFNWQKPAFFGTEGRDEILIFALLTTIMLLIGNFLSKRRIFKGMRILSLCLLVAFVLAKPSGGFSNAIDQLSNFISLESRKIKENDFYHVQKWASVSTPTDSLFLIDPGFWYGWRAYSNRSSFGNIREWLYTGILYRTDSSVLLNALERAKIFGIDAKAQLEGNSLRHLRPSKVREITRRVFYGMSENEFFSLRDKYGINFVVMEKALMQREISLPIAYENTGYAVFQL